MQSSIIVVCGLHNTGMAVIREQDLGKGRAAFEQWQDAAHNIFSEQLPADDDAAFDFRLNFSPRLPRQLWAMAVRIMPIVPPV